MPRIPLTAAALMALAASLAGFVGAAHEKNDKAPKPTTFIALLNPGQADPFPDDIKGMGVAFATLDEQTHEFCFSLSYDEPKTSQTGAHIHGPAKPGVNGSVIYDFTDASSPVQRCFGPLKPKQRRQLRAGLWYVNIHSEVYIHGELRGQIVPVSAPQIP